MKILHIYKDYYPPTIGGIEIHMNTLIEATRERCEEIKILISNTRSKTEVVEIEGIEVTKAAEFGRLVSNPINPTLPWLLRKGDFDILHFHLPLPSAVMSYLIAKPKGKVVVTYHSDIVRQASVMGLYGPFLRKFLSQADLIIASSEKYKRSSPYLQGFEDKIRVVPYGIETKKFELTPEVNERAARIRRQHGEKIILFVGRLCYYKGLEYLLEAMRNVPARLLIVGDGPLEQKFLQNQRLLPYRDKIVFQGRVENPTPYYYAADIFCLPSPYRSEAFGLVQLEAGYCGLPLVSCNIDTGVSFVNQDGVTGILVPPMESQKLGEALKTLCADAELRKQYGAAAHRRITEEFSVDRMIERTWAVYEEAMKG